MFSEVTELLFPDEEFTLQPKPDPQDIPKEEKKEKLNFSESVAKECDAFLKAKSLRQISVKSEILKMVKLKQENKLEVERPTTEKDASENTVL